MLKRSVIASDITNLTDARYFAAKGVEYMHFNLNQISTKEIMAITEWVEGVKTLVQMDEGNIHLIEEVILRISPYAVGTGDEECLDKILQYSSSEFIFYDFAPNENEKRKVMITEKENVDPQSFVIDTQSKKQAFLEIMPSTKELKNFLELSEAGLILRGSYEEEIGLKSFDNMDMLFEILEND